jgi:hypothetical protein
VTATAHLALAAGVVQPVLVLSNSLRNDGHISLEADSVSSLYLASHCSVVIGTAYLALAAPAVKANLVELV